MDRAMRRWFHQDHAVLRDTAANMSMLRWVQWANPAAVGPALENYGVIQIYDVPWLFVNNLINELQPR